MTRKTVNANQEDVLKSYFSQIKAIPLLTFEEELELSKQIEKGNLLYINREKSRAWAEKLKSSPEEKSASSPGESPLATLETLLDSSLTDSIPNEIDLGKLREQHGNTMYQGSKGPTLPLRKAYGMARKFADFSYKEGARTAREKAKLKRDAAKQRWDDLKAAQKGKTEYYRKLRSMTHDLQAWAHEANIVDTKLAAIEKSLLKKFFDGLYLHRRKPETAQRVAETRQFMTEHADDWGGLNPQDRDAAQRMSIDELVSDMNLDRLEEVY